MFTFEQERVCDTPAITSLLNIVFGADRFKKASYAVRHNIEPVKSLCQVVRCDEQLAATIRFWPIEVSDLLTGARHNALLLGPLAVAPSFQGLGIGTKLMKRTLSSAAAMGHQRILLVGDASYYGRFGFVSTLPSCITLPGGRDARRLLVKQSALVPSLPAVGRVEPLVQATINARQRALAIAS